MEITITFVKDEESFAPIIEKWNRAVKDLHKATPSDWNNKPMSAEQHYVIMTDILVPQVAMERIQHGHIPTQMEDQWFVFCEKNIIRVFRSGTGCNMFNAYFTQIDDEYHITQIEVDTEEHNSNPRHATAELDCFLDVMAMLCGVRLDREYGCDITSDDDDTVPQPESEERPIKERFRAYLFSLRKRSTAGVYISMIDYALRQFIKDEVDESLDSVYSFTTEEELNTFLDCLNGMPSFVELNMEKHRAITAALKIYKQFLNEINQ